MRRCVWGGFTPLCPQIIRPCSCTTFPHLPAPSSDTILHFLPLGSPQVALQLEQERHSSAAKDAQLALLRQRLRSEQATSPDIDEGSSASSALAGGRRLSAAGGSGCHSRKRSLPVSGWEELIEEAAADLEQVGWDVCENVRWLMAEGELISSSQAKAIQTNIGKMRGTSTTYGPLIPAIHLPSPLPPLPASLSICCTRKLCTWWSCRGGPDPLALPFPPFCLQLECLVHEAALRVVELQGRGVQLAEELVDGCQRKAEQEGQEAAAREQVEVRSGQQGCGAGQGSGACEEGGNLIHHETTTYN